MKINTLYLGPCITNCYIVSNESRCVVIDPAGDADKIISHINKYSLSLDAILLTHGHFDHIYAIPQLLSEYGKDMPVYIHRDDVPYLCDVNLNLSLPLFGVDFTCTANTISVQNNSVINAADLTFTVAHTPGHTPGSVCYICENTLFSGDTLFASTVGRTDFPGGDFPTLLKSLTFFKSIKGNYDIYPGHNASTSLERELKYNEYLQM